VRTLISACALLLVLATTACDKRTSYKGRPAPKSSIACWDGKTVKNVGPWACDGHGGRVGVDKRPR
jgi:hypothetical protein